MAIREVLTAPRSPWQNAYAERFIGSIRRERLDHVIVANERGLRRILRAYVEYYLTSRTHLSRQRFFRYPGRSQGLATARSWRLRTSAACITATSVTRRSTTCTQLS